jgi:hypothetical protein
MTQDLEAVKPVAPERGQDGELERSFAELDLPFFGIFGRWRARIFHSNILCSAMYVVKRDLNKSKIVLESWCAGLVCGAFLDTSAAKGAVG